jgi:hypothetical protein
VSPVFGEILMGRLTVTRDHSTHRWVVRKGGDWVHDWPERCWHLAYAYAWQTAVMESLSIEGVET